MENPIKIDVLGVPLFLETPTWHLKMDGWNTIEVSFWVSDYFQVRTVSFREGKQEEIQISETKLGFASDAWKT